MGTTWQVVVDDPLPPATLSAVRRACQAAVDEVDDLMSTWKPDSALMRLNAAPVGDWLPIPGPLLDVLGAGLAVSAATGGAFEMNVGDAVRAWGFGPARIDLAAIHRASNQQHVPAMTALDLDRGAERARKRAHLSLDLCGIAKGFGVDRLAEVALAHGVRHALCSIDGEVRALGPRADGQPWGIGIDAPDSPERGGHSILALADAAVATSGDYRHFLMVRGKRLSHTMNPATRRPLIDACASVTVLGRSSMMADAMATALMVLGPERGRRCAEAQGISALFVKRDGRILGTGHFAEEAGETIDVPQAVT